LHKVSKVLSFSYGHRLINYDGKCKNLHGHNAKVEIVLASQALDVKGMVFDFGDVQKKLKGWIDQNWDHRMILSESDPLLAVLRKTDPTVTTITTNPTAENLAKILFEKAKELDLPIVEISFWETENSKATYSASST